MPNKYEGDNICSVGLDQYHDYVCDGTHDEVQIMQAVDYVGSRGGGVVQIDAGTYDIAATIQKEYNNVTIRGSGRGSTILKASASGIKLLGIEQIDTVNASIYNTRIQGITFDMNFLSHGIMVRNTINFVIEDCEFLNNSNKWAILAGMTNVTDYPGYYGRMGIFKDLYFYNNTGTTVESVNLGQGKDFVFENCIFDTSSSTGVVYSWFALNVFFNRCTFKNGSHLCVDGDGPVLVNNCVFYDSELVATDGARSLLVSGCKFFGTSDSLYSGIRVGGIYRSGAEAAWYESGAVYVDRLMIENCEFYNCHEYGIKITPYFTDNSSNNYISAKSVDIRGCHFENNYWFGIEGYAINMTIVNNNFVNNNRANGSIKAAFYGGADKLLFDGNKIYENNGASKQTYAACFRNFLKDVSLSSSMYILAPDNFAKGGFKYYYSSAEHDTLEAGDTLTYNNLITT